MTASDHHQFGDMAGAYALEALDAQERQAFEAHLSSCAECRREVAELVRVTGALGASVEAIDPPASLRARTLARATAGLQARTATSMSASPPVRMTRDRGWSFQGVAAAAGIVIAISASIYAWSLHSQVRDLRGLVVELSERANQLRNSLDDARRERARLSRVLDVIQTPGTVLVSLSGTPAAPDASGQAYLNPARGMVVVTSRMPALSPGRAYQLWMVMPNQPKPIGAGVFAVSPAGTATVDATLPSGFSVPPGTPVTVAVTEEPAGGSAGPTSQILIAGTVRM